VKPPYRVPTMAEVEAVPWNGRIVASTFSGTGGSCLGYRMAGFRVAWASEFIPAAQEAYRANHPTSTLDTRDIREVQPQEILDALGLKVGELDVLDGSPPCASFSTSGKREKGWGETKAYSDSKQRTDDLFHEFIRILRGLRPKMFVAENVDGLVRGVARGYFVEILRELRASGYRVQAVSLDAAWLGVPQHRRRLIFVGVRENLATEPRHPEPLPYVYTVADAIPWVLGGEAPPGLGPTAIDAKASFVGYAIEPAWFRLRLGEVSRKYLNLIRSDPGRPSPTVTATGGQQGAAAVTHPIEPRKYTLAELRRICSFPDDFVLPGDDYPRSWERLGRSVPPVMMRAIASTVAEVLDEAERGPSAGLPRLDHPSAGSSVVEADPTPTAHGRDLGNAHEKGA
jgi:DNA (cytosine-5)-methyltransferase 1